MNARLTVRSLVAALAMTLSSSTFAAAQESTAPPATSAAPETAAPQESSAPATPRAEPPASRMLLVVGASGTPEFEKPFREWSERLVNAANKAHAPCDVIGLASSPDQPEKEDRERLKETLERWASEATGDASATTKWLVLIGHGTFDGKTARFNLRGPDVSSEELKGWLAGTPGPLAVIDCTSCSGPFIASLSGPDRVIVTATKSGHELNFARFGDYFSSALADPAADLDKDEQTSLLEAFLLAQNKTREFYVSDNRLETEHALIDDNGDGLGTPGEWFQGLRPTKQAKAGASLDGSLAARLVLLPSAREENWSAERRAKRDGLERRLIELRHRKASLPEAEYLALLEPVLIELAKLSLDEGQGSSPAPSPDAPEAPEAPEASKPTSDEPAGPPASDASTAPPTSASR